MELDTIVCGDCLDVMADMPDGCVDLVVTSPPYDNLRTYQGYTFKFELIAQEIHRIIKKGGMVVWVVGDATVGGSETGTSFQQALYFKDTCGFKLHDTMIYEKECPVPLKSNRYQPCFEYMFVLSRGKPQTFNPIEVPCVQAGGINLTKHRKPNGILVEATGYKRDICPTKRKKNIWCFQAHGKASASSDLAFKHPAIFPESLARDHILSWSNAGELIFDPLIGSGTTAVVALKLGRHFYGCDINPEYVELANERIEKAWLEMAQLSFSV